MLSLFNAGLFPVFVVSALSWATGYFALRSFTGNTLNRGQHFFAAPAVGFAVSAAVTFFGIIFFPGNSLFMWTARLLILFALIGIQKRGVFRKIQLSTAVSASVLCVSSVVLILLHAGKSPFGTGMDVWAIWKLKAVFFYRDPEQWTKIFSPELYYSHPEYPILYPLAISGSWFMFQKELHASALVLSTIFSVSQIGLIISSDFIKPAVRYGACLLLLSAPHWTGMGASQYADPAAAYYLLLSILLISVYLRSGSERMLLWAGIICGIGSLVKNEGLYFFLSAAAVLIFVIRNGSWKIFILGGSVPVLSTILFKIISRDSNHMFSLEQFLRIIEMHTVFERAQTVLIYTFRSMNNENLWVYGWFVISAVYLFRSPLLRDKEKSLPAMMILLQYAGYLFILTFSRLDLEYHLINSIDRLLYHLFPACLLTACLLFPAAEKNPQN